MARKTIAIGDCRCGVRRSIIRSALLVARGKAAIWVQLAVRVLLAVPLVGRLAAGQALRMAEGSWLGWRVLALNAIAGWL